MDTSRLPPHSLEAEQAVNGSLLLNGSILGRISSMLRPEDFLSERDRLIYSACLALDDRNESIDITTVADELSREGTKILRKLPEAHVDLLAQVDVLPRVRPEAELLAFLFERMYCAS